MVVILVDDIFKFIFVYEMFVVVYSFKFHLNLSQETIYH